MLVHRTNASAVSSVLAAKGKRKYYLKAPLCWKDASDAALHNDWLVIPANSNAAALLAVDEALVQSVAKSGGRYYPGVRCRDRSLRPAAKPDWRALPSGLEMDAENPEPAADTATAAAAAQTFTFAEFFAGIGGFRLGLEALGGRCVFAAEVDPACRETYAANFGTRGLGGGRVVSCGEENLLDIAADPWFRDESVLCHELGHTVMNLGLSEVCSPAQPRHGNAPAVSSPPDRLTSPLPSTLFDEVR